MIDMTELLNMSDLDTVLDVETSRVFGDEREDVKQSAILRILEVLNRDPDRYTSQSPKQLGGLARTIIRRTVVDFFRSKNTLREKNSTSVFYCDGDGEDSDDGFYGNFAMESHDSNFDMADVRMSFEQNTRVFTPSEKLVIEQMLFNEDGIGQTLKEISDDLRLNKSHATRAFKKLVEVCA